MDIRDAHEALGHAVKKRRVALGLSQEQLAGRASVSRSTIQNIERGSVTRPSSLPHIAAALGTDLDTLRRTAGEQEPTSTTDEDRIARMTKIVADLQAEIDALRGGQRKESESD